MEQQPVKLRCQRIGCDAMFTEDDNPEGSCRYHESPLFHDGMKEWSCCKKRSHDFTSFLAIPGCKTGKHTTEKQVFAQPKKNPVPAPAPAPASTTNGSSRDSCLRCRQGFFCSDHGSQSKPLNPVVNAPSEGKASAVPKQPKKTFDINETQKCKNKGCGKEFKEKDNHDAACSYHPGPAVFHDRLRGWKCCDIHVKEFDEFMSIPPCTKGWHNADPES
ncbi:hypothetical protein K1719_017007 [Acacia pycnantha]|nr:hypothetical protein K1719_017007 [Acacia pycnantha]